jgi:hypothetical protein
VFAMSGGTLAHELTMTNCHDELSSHLTGRCLVFSSKMQIKVPSAPPYRYADGASCAAKRKSSGLTETTCF